MKRVLSLLLALVLMLGLLPQIALATDTLELELNLRYDDYKDMTGKTVEIIDACYSGQDPVIELKSNKLIATGIGTAKLRIDGEVYNVTVEKAKINLIMIMGQSNAGNFFANATSDVTCPEGTAYWWGNGKGTSASEPVSYTQRSKGFHTPLLAELYAQSEAAGDPVKNVMIWQEGITSKNGQSIIRWAASATDTSGTDDAVTMLENCRAYYQKHSDKYEIVGNGVYWLQGESDTATNPLTYTQCFMAMWERLKNAGMEYVAFMRVRDYNINNSNDADDLYHSASLSAQIKMINENPDFYMASTVTENWVGTPTVSHTIDISNYITLMNTYGGEASHTDKYGNDATYADGKLTTTMKTLYGSNNRCHYGKFGYGIIGADAAYNMYRALHEKQVSIVVTDTSGRASSVKRLKDGESMTVNIMDMTEDLSFRADCGSTNGTLKIAVLSGTTDITDLSGVVRGIGARYGAISTNELQYYPNVSINISYTTLDGAVHTVICYIESDPVEQQKDYIWNFDGDLNARGENGEVLNSFLENALYGSYTLDDGYLTGDGLQLQLENAIELRATREWSIEWKYGSLANGTAGFLLSEDAGNTIGNKALWHHSSGCFAISDYKNSSGYYNYTSNDVLIQDYDCVKLTNFYDPVTEKNTISLWINGELRIADFQQKGSINNCNDDRDMTGYPLIADFVFQYLGNSGVSKCCVGCQLDYLKISFGEIMINRCSHSYSDEITIFATCIADGIKTYTCCECGDSYTETIPATGHNYAGRTCTFCGAANPDYVANYYLVGHIDGTNYGCEEDWENMGQYQFVDGTLVATFNQDSFVFLKSEQNADWYMTKTYCTDATATFYNTNTGSTETMFVPGGREITFTLVENADGSLTLSYIATPIPSTQPTLTLKAPTLEFKDMVTINAMFTAANTEDVVEMGMITYSTEVSVWSVETASHVIPGTVYDSTTGRYIAQSQGIHAKYLGDTVYLAIYAKLTDGSYVYTDKLASYSPVQYANSQLKSAADPKLKQLVVAMLNYGAEAQLYFGHNTDTLANASLTADQKALPEAYRSDMVSAVPAVPTAKQGLFVNNQGFAKRTPSISFEGAFCINYFFVPNYVPDSGITLYYWHEADYNATNVLTAANATGKFKLEGDSTGVYRGDITDIAAKALSEAVYVACAYKSNGTVWISGILGYSIGAYCSSQASEATAISNLAKATAVYGYQAKQYFG